jgi:hypothetical protein
MTVVPIKQAPADQRPYADPKHPGNRIRHKVECIGCGRRGCVTYWGPWCFECNVRRMDRINAAFEPVRKALGMEP